MTRSQTFQAWHQEEPQLRDTSSVETAAMQEHLYKSDQQQQSERLPDVPAPGVSNQTNSDVTSQR